MAEKPSPAAGPSGGIRRARTTSLFRITNFELFAKPVRERERESEWERERERQRERVRIQNGRFLVNQVIGCDYFFLYLFFNVPMLSTTPLWLEQESNGNRSWLHHWMHSLPALPQPHSWQDQANRKSVHRNTMGQITVMDIRPLNYSTCTLEDLFYSLQCMSIMWRERGGREWGNRGSKGKHACLV